MEHDSPAGGTGRRPLRGAGVAIDNARLFQDSQRHCAQVRRRREWPEITGDLSRELLSTKRDENVLAGFVARHAVASKVEVDVSADTKAATLTVTDNGAGSPRAGDAVDLPTCVNVPSNSTAPSPSLPGPMAARCSNGPYPSRAGDGGAPDAG